MYSKFIDYDADKSAVNTWIYTIARNTLIDHFRKMKPTGELDENIPADTAVESSLLSRETLSELADALRLLPQEQRDIVVLHYYQGRSLQEIAGALNLPYGTAKRAHQAALLQLRGLLGEV